LDAFFILIDSIFNNLLIYISHLIFFLVLILIYIFWVWIGSSFLFMRNSNL
jgi:hypothetical protein